MWSTNFVLLSLWINAVRPHTFHQTMAELEKNPQQVQNNDNTQISEDELTRVLTGIGAILNRASRQSEDQTPMHPKALSDNN